MLLFPTLVLLEQSRQAEEENRRMVEQNRTKEEENRTVQSEKRNQRRTENGKERNVALGAYVGLLSMALGGQIAADGSGVSEHLLLELASANPQQGRGAQSGISSLTVSGRGSPVYNPRPSTPVNPAEVPLPPSPSPSKDENNKVPLRLFPWHKHLRNKHLCPRDPPPKRMSHDWIALL